MKKILLSILSICIITLSANAINYYELEPSTDSSNITISIAYDASAKMWQAGKKTTPDYIEILSEVGIGTRIGFNIEGTANCTSGNGFIYIATHEDDTANSWTIVSDTIEFSISANAFSTLDYVTLNDKVEQVTSAEFLYIIFAGQTSELTANNQFKFQFSRYKTSSASPYEQTLALPFPDITIKLGEIAPRIKLTDYFISNSPLTFEIEANDQANSSGVVMGDYLGFNVSEIGTTYVYFWAYPNNPTGEPESPAMGYVTVHVIKNELIPDDCNIVINSTSKEPTCSGKRDGSIELEVSGGVEPYSFRWNNQRTSQNLYNIEEGRYAVTVIDSLGCIASEDVFIYSSFYASSSSIQYPTCGQSDGSINIECNDASATYLWNTGSTEQNLTNVPAGYYTVMVTNASGCSQKIETYISDMGGSNPPSIYIDYDNSIYQIDCNTTDGALYTTIYGGTEPFTYTWVNSNSTTSSATNLSVGNYAIIVTDAENCKSVATATIHANSFYTYNGPDISSVTISEETNNMLIFWQKPKTDYVDFYTLYRERNDNPGVYDTIGTVSYNNVSVFADQEVDPNLNSWRYKLSATDFCGNESKMSFREYKSIHLNYNIADDNTITLQWDPYEGMSFDRYSIFKITKNGNVKVAEVSPNCTRYSEKLESGTKGYLIAVEFLDTIDVMKLLKAESGPFSLAMSNIAELENVSAKQVSITPNAKVSVKQNTIIVDNPNKSNIAVYDILGHSVAKNTSRAGYVTIPMAGKGIYLVIVGNEAFKVMVQ